MKASVRRDMILQYLEENHLGYTTDLCAKFDVSAMTIHRDFEAMAKQGLVTRIRGGAALNHGTAVLYSLNLRQTKHPAEKKRIASYCANLVQEGMSVFIDCGSTPEHIAELLQAKRGLTILTNSLDTAQILSQNSDNRLIMVPGVFDPALRGFFGPMATSFMERFLVDILFLGANGIDAKFGMTAPNFTDAEMKRFLLSHAQKVVVGADHTKLGTSFFEQVTPISAIDLIVTDKDASPEKVKEMEEAGTEVHLV